MADTKKIVIELVTSGTTASGSNNQQEETANSEQVQNAVSSLVDGKNTAEVKALARNTIVSMSSQNAIQSIKNVGQYHIYKYFSLNEDYKGELMYSNIQTGINKLSGFSASFVAGTVMTGTPIGGVVSSAGWAITEAINNYKTLDQQRIYYNESNYQTSFSQTRLGLIDGRGETNQ